jgi:outer membrane protein assembly factor BamD (BamD/ComL family)
MLDEARARVSSRDAAGALAALDRYTTAFPRGVFLPEARVLRIEALLLAGDRAAATRLADDLLRTEPNGPYAQRVRTMMHK